MDAAADRRLKNNGTLSSAIISAGEGNWRRRR